jgi:pyrroloquinoline quinone biosynthesis protein B
MKISFYFFLVLLFSCQPSEQNKSDEPEPAQEVNGLSLIILGTLQDGGSPHAGCEKKCCKELFKVQDPSRQVVSLGIVDPENKRNYLIEATPDLPKQLRTLRIYSQFKTSDAPDGIFITHAHIGHYSGLMYLGKEVMNASNIPVYVLPRMKNFLESNGPWSQLVKLNNVSLIGMQSKLTATLSSSLKITAIQVPHRDEFSETVGFVIEGPNKKVLFIPDIDKWDKWDKQIFEEIQKVDYAFIDGTFYDGKEINNRDIAEIPHPFVIESMELFKSLENAQKQKIYFIHFNHTNPLLDASSEESKTVKERGFNITQRGEVFAL